MKENRVELPAAARDSDGITVGLGVLWAIGITSACLAILIGFSYLMHFLGI